MKFKIAVLGLLSAILATCIFTSYTLINEAKTQTILSKYQTEAIMIMERMSRDDESTKAVPRNLTGARHAAIEKQWKEYIGYNWEDEENWLENWKKFIESN